MSKKKDKTYEVTIEQVYSQTYKVRAKSQAEAKKIAWGRFKPQKKLFRFWVDLTQFDF